MENFGNKRIWPTDEGQLYKAILRLKTVGECFAFFRDLCTPGEIKALKERWEIAQLLDKGELSYRQIAEKTGASIATIGRVARFLKDENYLGYRLVLDRIKAQPNNNGNNGNGDTGIEAPSNNLKI